eukprot:TRINITY_DN22010_c0_g1_i6.p1 TRINITY_DN22010_c0_g1~~TRINITY_DN22010_c0_g1_i6.p1  ORF type:complete len:352 (-),score=34.64 TRINITY_DN22010_c0_g1_i6:10-960(-)
MAIKLQATQSPAPDDSMYGLTSSIAPRLQIQEVEDDVYHYNINTAHLRACIEWQRMPWQSAGHFQKCYETLRRVWGSGDRVNSHLLHAYVHPFQTNHEPEEREEPVLHPLSECILHNWAVALTTEGRHLDLQGKHERAAQRYSEAERKFADAERVMKEIYHNAHTSHVATLAVNRGILKYHLAMLGEALKPAKAKRKRVTKTGRKDSKPYKNSPDEASENLRLRKKAYLDEASNEFLTAYKIYMDKRVVCDYVPALFLESANMFLKQGKLDLAISDYARSLSVTQNLHSSSSSSSSEIGRAVQQECRDRSRMPSSA